jgi:hypothetical protein
MEQYKKFCDILMKPEYTEYKDAWIMIRHEPYVIKMPVTTNKTYDDFPRLAYAKIIYHLEHTSPTKVKQGRPRKYNYKDKSEANHLYL